MGKETIPHRVTLRDVALAAQVSIATASRALTGHGSSSAATVAAVVAASERLGYRPDPAARSLRAQVSGLIGMVVPGVRNPFFSELIDSLESELQAVGTELVLCDSRGDEAQQLQRIRTLNDRRVDGLILAPISTTLSDRLAAELARQANIVQIDREIAGLEADYVGVDNRVGIRLILKHLQQRGVRTVGFVSGEELTSTGSSRLGAFRDTVAAFEGIASTRVLLGDFSVDFGLEAGARLLADGELPDALVCGSDVIAIGLMRALHAGGHRVPDDVLVTGFDGIAFSELSDPPLTTVAQPYEAIAAESVRLLHQRMRGDRSPARSSSIRPSLVVRGSA
ncbi:MAG: LacI family DNA-binding transcriptional regulator [Microbacteriaceae bacterium]